jgi:hypothetical protein
MSNRRHQHHHDLLLGDVGHRTHGITPWLLTPHKDPATPAEVAYNNLHKTERVWTTQASISRLAASYTSRHS